MDSAALRDELERLHAASFGWAMACCGRRRFVAENALQAAYLKVLSGSVRFEGRSSFRTWLFGVIRRTAMEESRRAVLRLLMMRQPDAETPEDAALQNERVYRITSALRRLPRRQAQVIELVFYHHLSLDDAAAVMGIATGSARTHYARGKLKLRELLSDMDRRHERRRTAADIL
jgi:RNA polymerase sigma factor (sigma-70 family)